MFEQNTFCDCSEIRMNQKLVEYRHLYICYLSILKFTRGEIMVQGLKYNKPSYMLIVVKRRNEHSIFFNTFLLHKRAVKCFIISLATVI